MSADDIKPAQVDPVAQAASYLRAAAWAAGIDQFDFARSVAVEFARQAIEREARE